MQHVKDMDSGLRRDHGTTIPPGELPYTSKPSKLYTEDGDMVKDSFMSTASSNSGIYSSHTNYIMNYEDELETIDNSCTVPYSKSRVDSLNVRRYKTEQSSLMEGATASHKCHEPNHKSDGSLKSMEFISGRKNATINSLPNLIQTQDPLTFSDQYYPEDLQYKTTNYFLPQTWSECSSTGLDSVHNISYFGYQSMPQDCSYSNGAYMYNLGRHALERFRGIGTNALPSYFQNAQPDCDKHVPPTTEPVTIDTFNCRRSIKHLNESDRRRDVKCTTMRTRDCSHGNEPLLTVFYDTNGMMSWSSPNHVNCRQFMKNHRRTLCHQAIEKGEISGNVMYPNECLSMEVVPYQGNTFIVHPFTS